MSSYFKISAFLICFFSTIILSAQIDSLILTKNYLFKDGVYLSFEAFQSNTPDYTWEELRTNAVTNPQTFLTQIQFVYLKREDGDIPLDINELWGVTLGGIPYLRLPQGTINKDLSSFAGLQLRGKICYFSYEDHRMVKIAMPVYNPLTGRPFRTGYVERRKKITFEKILNFETGEVADLTVDNLLRWIQDDPKLVHTIESLSAEEANEKLFKLLLIYDDRNVTRVKKNPNPN